MMYNNNIKRRGDNKMATKTSEFSTEISGNEEFGCLIMDALGDFPNYATSVSGNTAKCDEITAPKVGMGFNKWQRGRAYSIITYDSTEKTISVETTIQGLCGAAFNGKYAGEICEMLASKIKNQQIKQKKEKTVLAPASSSADELKKFKELLDSGVISQEEFDLKKKQLLGL